MAVMTLEWFNQMNYFIATKSELKIWYSHEEAPIQIVYSSADFLISLKV